VRRDLDWPALSARVGDSLITWGRLDRSTRVLLYDPLPDEIDLTYLSESVEALLSRTPEDGEMTVHRFEAPRERHRYGFSQPIAGEAEVDPADIDVVLLPGLAFDLAGVRLGRGGGHFDRLLPRLRADRVLVGVAPEAVVVERLPREEHDVRVTHLATEVGVRQVAGREG
jgi:5-formyltetrahydrofolate cyclo-ligase